MTDSTEDRLNKLEAWIDRLFDHTGIERPPAPPPAAAAPKPVMTTGTITGGVISTPAPEITPSGAPSPPSAQSA